MTERESEVVAAIIRTLGGVKDPTEILASVVTELAQQGQLPEHKVAILLTKIISAHPEGAGMVRIAQWLDSRPGRGVFLHGLFGGMHGSVTRRSSGEWVVIKNLPGDMLPGSPSPRSSREAAWVAVCAAQPEPQAVVPPEGW